MRVRPGVNEDNTRTKPDLNRQDKTDFEQPR